MVLLPKIPDFAAQEGFHHVEASPPKSVTCIELGSAICATISQDTIVEEFPLIKLCPSSLWTEGKFLPWANFQIEDNAYCFEIVTKV